MPFVCVTRKLSQIRVLIFFDARGVFVLIQIKFQSLGVHKNHFEYIS